jgi:hypothetical protein
MIGAQGAAQLHWYRAVHWPTIRRYFLRGTIIRHHPLDVVPAGDYHFDWKRLYRV